MTRELPDWVSPETVAVRGGLMRSGFFETSATVATKLPKLWCTAMPRNRPSAGGCAQPASAAAFSSTARWRAPSGSSLRRRATGSWPVAAAISSIIVSMT